MERWSLSVVAERWRCELSASMLLLIRRDILSSFHPWRAPPDSGGGSFLLGGCSFWRGLLLGLCRGGRVVGELVRLRRGRRLVLGLHGVPDLLPVHGDRLGGRDADADARPADLD